MSGITPHVQPAQHSSGSGFWPVAATGLGTPEYTLVTHDACTAKGAASPCYAVRWSRQYEIHQHFAIFFQ